MGAKFSILVPSKDRLRYLGYALESVREQNYPDCEIIISDNCSQEDYQKFIEDFGDERIIYFRQPEPVSVTQNWSSALSLASGDYIVMLGDDDALAPGYFDRVLRCLKHLESPDVIWLTAYHYCYPDVMPGMPEGYLATVRNSVFLQDRNEPFVLPDDVRKECAEAVFDFRYLFGFNSQHFVFSASSVEKAKKVGGLFQGPYPDTFAAVISFSQAQRVGIMPEPSVIIGISPQSFGYYYFTGMHEEGFAFLANRPESKALWSKYSDRILPGDPNNTNWLVAAASARVALGHGDLTEKSVRRYRMLQIIASIKATYLDEDRNIAELQELESLLDENERLIFQALQSTAKQASACSKSALTRHIQHLQTLMGQFCAAETDFLDIGKHSDIRDCLRWLKLHSVQ